MKKLLSLVLVSLITSVFLFAGNIYFAFGDIGQHPDILVGFFPSYAYLGAGYRLPSLIEGNTTDLQLLVSGGELQRLLWQDKDSGENNYDNGIWDRDSALRFNVFVNEVTLRLRQGFLQSPVKGKDLLLLTLQAGTRYEKYTSRTALGPFDLKGNPGACS